MGNSGGAAFNKLCCCLTPSEPENVSAHMEVTVKVTNQNFTKELLNRSSSEFQKFNETFIKQVALGEQVPMVTQFSPGRCL